MPASGGPRGIRRRVGRRRRRRARDRRGPRPARRRAARHRAASPSPRGASSLAAAHGRSLTVDLRRRGLGDRRPGPSPSTRGLPALSPKPRDRSALVGATTRRGPRPEVAALACSGSARALRGARRRAARPSRAERGPCSRGTPQRAGGRPARPRPLASRVARPPPSRRAGRRVAAFLEGFRRLDLVGSPTGAGPLGLLAGHRL